MNKRENPDQNQDTPSNAKRARTSAIDFETEDSKPSASEQVLKSATNEYLCIGNVSISLRMQDSRGRCYSVKRINLAQASYRKITAAMLEDECDQNESFEHANLIRYFRNFYSVDGAYFHIVNENLESGTLVDQVQANPAPTEGRITEWLEQIASALNYMHEMGVLHGDLTPENVLLTASGKIKINTPTVLHAHTKAEALIYTSHERCNGLPFDGRDDMWAVGCILAELLAKTRLMETCRVPLSHPTHPPVMQRRRQVLEEAALNSWRLGGLILPYLLSPLQEHRYTAQQLVNVLRTVHLVMPSRTSSADKPVHSTNVQLPAQGSPLPAAQRGPSSASVMHIPTEQRVPAPSHTLGVPTGCNTRTVRSSPPVQGSTLVTPSRAVIPAPRAIGSTNHSLAQQIATLPLETAAQRENAARRLLALHGLRGAMSLVSLMQSTFITTSQGATKLLRGFCAVSASVRESLVEKDQLFYLASLTMAEKTQHQANDVLAALADYADSRLAMRREGLVQWFVQGLKDHYKPNFAACALGLLRLSKHGSLRGTMVVAGAIPLLVSVLQDYTPGNEAHRATMESAKTAAARLLWCVLSDPDCRYEVYTCRASLHLLHLLKHGTEKASIAAAGALGQLCRGGYTAQSEEKEAIPTVVQQLQSSSVCVKQVAIAVLVHFSSAGDHNTALIRECGALPYAQQLLQDGTQSSKQHARILLARLRTEETAEKTNQELATDGEAGAHTDTDQLVANLLGSSSAVEAAVTRLHTISEDQERAAAFVAAGAVPSLLQLLQRGADRVKVQSLGALWNLAVQSRSVQAALSEDSVSSVLLQLSESADPQVRDGAAALQAVIFIQM